MNMSIDAIYPPLAIDRQRDQSQNRKRQPQAQNEHKSGEDEPDTPSFLNAYNELIGSIINVAV
jgi:hypothetical protein